MTAPADLRHAEISPAELIAKLRSIAATANELAESVAALAGEPERVADRDEEADHRDVDTPSPGNMVALKVAAHRWGRSERNLKKIAADHGALHKVGGRNMIDDARLRAGVFGHVFPLLDR